MTTTKGGYPAGSKPIDQIKPPPASVTAGSDWAFGTPVGPFRTRERLAERCPSCLRDYTGTGRHRDVCVYCQIVDAREALDQATTERDDARAQLARILDASRVLDEVAAERARQDAKWGEQNHPDGTGSVWEMCSGQHAGWAEEAADDARRRCQEAPERTWGDTYALILNEEVAEAFAEEDPTRLREELVQVAAVAVAWVEAIDRRADVLSAGGEQCG